MKLRYYWASTIALLFFVTVLDHVVNKTLYDFGLQFSWDWFITYGSAMLLIWVFAGLRSAFLFYYNSPESVRLRISVAILLTDVAIWLGGFLDFLWFLINGILPPVEKVWWWMPQAKLIPGYGIAHHAVYTGCWFLGLLLLWHYARKNKV